MCQGTLAVLQEYLRESSANGRRINEKLQLLVIELLNSILRTLNPGAPFVARQTVASWKYTLSAV